MKNVKSKTFRIVWRVVVSLLAAFTVYGGFGGMVNPDVTTSGALAAMLFPLLALMTLVALVVSVWVDRWCMIPPAVALLATIGPMWEFCPLNFTHRQLTPEEEEERAFTLLSYNVLNFKNYKEEYPSDSTNATLSYILSADPDIACLVECEYMSEMSWAHVYQTQVDSIKERYPYIHIDEGGNSILSKWPFHKVDLQVPSSFEGRLAAYRVYVKWRRLTIFEVHMTSIGLSADDKELFKALTHLNAVADFDKVRHQLLGKLSVAFRSRAQQARNLRDYINRVGGENIIVCGDFNDIPDCYAIRTICGDNLKNAFSEAGFGPSITYYANRFYFRIDHILYSGELDPVWIRRGDIKTSDHYPLMAQFLWKERPKAPSRMTFPNRTSN